MPWYAMALSIMATRASAVTFTSTPGQAYVDGMRVSGSRRRPAGILGLVLAMILGSLVEAVNLLGSFFYGGMLGVFVLAVAFPRVRGRGAFWGVVCGEAVIFGCWCFTGIVFLWYNVIGCAAVVLTGLIVTAVAPGGTGESHVGDDERYFTGATLADQGGT
jgi:Na+/proline symporter